MKQATCAERHRTRRRAAARPATATASIVAPFYTCSAPETTLSLLTSSLSAEDFNFSLLKTATDNGLCRGCIQVEEIVERVIIQHSHK